MKNLTFIKAFLFSAFILKSFVASSMEESKENMLLFKGVINLTNKPMYLFFGKPSPLFSSFWVEVQPKTIQLKNYEVSSDLEGNYEQFGICNPEDAFPKVSKQKPSGNYKQFMIVIHNEDCKFEEISAT